MAASPCANTGAAVTKHTTSTKRLRTTRRTLMKTLQPPAEAVHRHVTADVPYDGLGARRWSDDFLRTSGSRVVRLDYGRDHELRVEHELAREDSGFERQRRERGVGYRAATVDRRVIRRRGHRLTRVMMLVPRR